MPRYTSGQTGGMDLHTPAIRAAVDHLFAAESALAYFAAIEDDYLSTALPLSCLSSGEQALWFALGCLHVSAAPDEALAVADGGELDSSNSEALRGAVAAWSAASAEVAA